MKKNQPPVKTNTKESNSKVRHSTRPRPTPQGGKRDNRTPPE